jgi:hypothetical protein
VYHGTREVREGIGHVPFLQGANLPGESSVTEDILDPP